MNEQLPTIHEIAEAMREGARRTEFQCFIYVSRQGLLAKGACAIGAAALMLSIPTFVNPALIVHTEDDSSRIYDNVVERALDQLPMCVHPTRSADVRLSSWITTMNDYFATFLYRGDEFEDPRPFLADCIEAWAQHHGV